MKKIAFIIFVSLASLLSLGMVPQQQIGQQLNQQEKGICWQACYNCCCDLEFLSKAGISACLIGIEHFRLVYSPSESARMQKYYPLNKYNLFRRLRSYPQEAFLDTTAVVLDFAVTALESCVLLETANDYYKKHKEKLKKD
ncbi:hypothetical protein BH09DEP1_BH09DEP1_0390 [soil metagenome]